MNKEAHNVSVFDETYSLVTDESEERLKSAAALVDERMRGASRAGIRDQRKIAVLVALQLASECLTLKENSDSYKKETRALIEWLEKHGRELSELL